MSMANRIQQVCTPRLGTIHSPSPRLEPRAVEQPDRTRRARVGHGHEIGHHRSCIDVPGNQRHATLNLELLEP